MQKITSTSNPLVKQLAELKQKRHREELRRFLVEGPHLLEEAHRHQRLQLQLVLDPAQALPGVPAVQVTADILQKLSHAVTPQGVLGVASYPAPDDGDHRRYILLDDLQDPGNLGTILRTAAAFGVDAVILGENCVDAYNEKVVRATQGALFRLAISRGNLAEEMPRLRARGIHLYGTRLQNAKPLGTLPLARDYALLLGNEGQGVSPALLALADDCLYIPMQGAVESLNVGVAAGILLHAFQTTNAH